MARAVGYSATGGSLLNLRHIVVATDESDAGRQAVRAGLDLAGRAGAKVTVMRVVSLPATPLIGAMAGGVENAELDAAGTALERLQRWLSADVLPAGDDLPVALGIAFGVPGIEICRFAEQRDADLLVLGRKHRSSLARLLLGDTADAVVRRSRVPCLFVQPGSRPIREILVALAGPELHLQLLELGMHPRDRREALLERIHRTVDDRHGVSQIARSVSSSSCTMVMTRAFAA